MITSAVRAAMLFALLGVALAAAGEERESAPADTEARMRTLAAAEGAERAEAAGVESAESAESAAEDARNAASLEVDPLSTMPVDEEVIVRGQRGRGALRFQIDRAQEAFYDRFNEINSDDELDIHCRSVVELGSRIARRRCEPNFMRTFNTEFAEETIIALQGGFAGVPEQAIAQAQSMSLELEKEMRSLAASDPKLRELLARLLTLQQAYSAQRD